MGKLKVKSVTYYSFYCPGCKYQHVYPVLNDGSGWQFNGNLETPSFTPSLLNTTKDEEGKTVKVCHLFITDGKICYCGDCTHELSGQTVELPEIT